MWCILYCTGLKSRRDVQRWVAVQRKGNVRGKSIWAPRHWAGVYTTYESARVLHCSYTRFASPKKKSPRGTYIIMLYGFPTLTFSRITSSRTATIWFRITYSGNGQRRSYIFIYRFPCTIILLVYYTEFILLFFYYETMMMCV
jgi:hypothetical protein